MIVSIAAKFTPLRQACICLLGALLGMIFCRIVLNGGAYEFMAAFTGIVFYSVMNSLISVFNENFAKYVWPSWGFFIALLFILLLAARFISGVSIWTLGEYRMMLGSITAFYFITSLLVRLIRALWQFAENDVN